jgi:hypothetical protein
LGRHVCSPPADHHHVNDDPTNYNNLFNNNVVNNNIYVININDLIININNRTDDDIFCCSCHNDTRLTSPSMNVCQVRSVADPVATTTFARRTVTTQR